MHFFFKWNKYKYSITLFYNFRYIGDLFLLPKYKDININYFSILFLNKFFSLRIDMFKKSGKLSGLILIMLSLSIIGVSAFVYDQASHTISQTIVNVATITVKNSALGNIEEGETKGYGKLNVTSLGNIINITSVKDGIFLHFDSDIDSLDSYYDTYDIIVKFAAVGSGSSHSVGDTACTLTLASPDDSVTLDKLGSWRFDFEITTTALGVSADQETTVTINVTAESS